MKHRTQNKSEEMITDNSMKIIFHYQILSFLNIALSTIFLIAYVHINNTYEMTAFTDTKAILDFFSYVFSIALSLFIAGYFLHFPRQVCLFFDGWKKEFLTNITLHKHVSMTSAIASPLIITAGQSLMISAINYQMVTLTVVLIFARIMLTVYRHKSIEQHKTDY